MQSTRAFSESTLPLPSGERVPAKQAGEGVLSLPLPSGERAGERGYVIRVVNDPGGHP